MQRAVHPVHGGHKGSSFYGTLAKKIVKLAVAQTKNSYLDKEERKGYLLLKD